MNEPQDPLETELTAFRPPGLSPEFQGRVAGRLADSHLAPGRRVRRAWAFALAAALAAACLAAVWLGWGGGHGGVERIPAAVSHSPVPTAPDDDAFPTVHAYRQALARSSADLEALLDRHAARVPGSTHRPDRAVRVPSGEL